MSDVLHRVGSLLYECPFLFPLSASGVLQTSSCLSMYFCLFLMKVETVKVLDLFLGFALFHLKQRWLGNIEITLLYHLRHLSVKEGQKQSSYMCAINISVCHKHTLVISYL